MIYNNCSKARHIIKLESVITPVAVSIRVTKVAVAAHSGGSPNRRRPTRTPNTIRREVHAHASERTCDAPDATEPRPRQRPSNKGQRSSIPPARPDSQRCPRAWAGAQDDPARARPRARAGRTRTVGRWRSVQAQEEPPRHSLALPLPRRRRSSAACTCARAIFVSVRTVPERRLCRQPLCVWAAGHPYSSSIHRVQVVHSYTRPIRPGPPAERVAARDGLAVNSNPRRLGLGSPPESGSVEAHQGGCCARARRPQTRANGHRLR
jgi:hypothetical protein